MNRSGVGSTEPPGSGGRGFAAAGSGTRVDVEGRRLAHEPRQGPLARDRLHQGAADRVLRRRRAGAAAAPRGPAAHAPALPGRCRRDPLAPERVPGRARLVPGLRDDRPRGAAAPLLPRRRSAGARLAREPGGGRAAPVSLEGGLAPRADADRLRPRPGAAGRNGRGGPRGARAATAARGARLRAAREDLGVARSPRSRPAHRGGRHEAAGARGCREPRGRAAGRGGRRDAALRPPREGLRRLAPERRHRQTVAPYSLRGVSRPLVATPVSWAEVERAAAGQAQLVFGPAAVLERIERHGDLFDRLV